MITASSMPKGLTGRAPKNVQSSRTVRRYRASPFNPFHVAGTTKPIKKPALGCSRARVEEMEIVRSE